MNNEASSGTSALDDGLERLRIAAGIELEDSFEAGSKWCVGDGELAALVRLAKQEELNACAKVCRDLADGCRKVKGPMSADMMQAYEYAEADILKRSNAEIRPTARHHRAGRACIDGLEDGG